MRDRDTLALPLGPGQPASFLHALGERERFVDLHVFSALLVDIFPLFARPGVRLLSGFFGPVERALAKAGHAIEYAPADFRRFEGLADRLRPRVLATLAAPPDARGYMSLSLHAGATVTALHQAARDPERRLVVEIHPALPRTLGLPPEHPHRLHVDEADAIVESDRPPFELPDPEPSQIDRAIAGHACRFIPDGATLQTGIGGIPSEIAELLAEGPGGDYGIHSEMFTTGLLRLHQAGKVSNRKGLFDGFSITTFALGTRELYDWLDGQQAVRFLPVSVVNDARVIAANRRMVSINGALAVDLYGQVAADSMGDEQYSGVGGHLDFCSAATRSHGGRSLVCLPSTATKDGRTLSRIVHPLPPGTPVTTPRHEVDVVVTEHGAAELQGRSVEERAEALVAVAHPDLRDELRSAWGKR